MKKIICVFLAVFMLACPFMGCARYERKPSDTNLEFWITENVKGYDFSEYHYIPGWGCEGYYGKDYAPITDPPEGESSEPEYYVKYTISAYPDHSSYGWRITSIEITDPEITFYGISMESSEEEIISAMKKHGYTRIVDEDDDSGIRRLEFEKGNIFFRFNDSEIYIRADVTNRFGIMF